MKKITNIQSNLNPNFHEKKTDESLKNSLKMDYKLNVSTTTKLPEPTGTIGKVIYNSIKSSGNETNLIEIFNNTTGNKSYLLVHPEGSFEMFNNDGDHVLKSVGDNIIVGKNVIIEASEEVLIKAGDLETLTDTIVTVDKLKQYLIALEISINKIGAALPTPIIPAVTTPAATSDLGTKNIKVGMGS